MPRIRCPQCGAVNSTRAPDYPFCVGCQDNLAKCGYCRWYDEGRDACTHPIVADNYDVHEHATPPCGHHSPREAIRLPAWKPPRLVWAGLVAAAFTVAYAVVRLFAPLPTPQPPFSPDLQLAIEAGYDPAVVGRPHQLEIVVYNTSNRVVQGVRLEIAKESLAHFYLREVRPSPIQRREISRWLTLTYPDMYPFERRRISISLVPSQPGTFDFIARLLSGEQRHHGIAHLPIAVQAGPGAHEEAPHESR